MKIDTLELRINSTDSIFIPYILTEAELVLVDVGYPNMSEEIDAALREKGLSLASVSQIWLTHHDHDHVGSLAQIKGQYPSIRIKASAAETPAIQGEVISLRLRQAIAQQESLPQEAQAGGIAFQEYLNTIVPCKVDETLFPKQALLDGEIQVLDTAGHTEGHISFYSPASQTLIAGDLLVIESGALCPPFPQYAFDFARVKQSILAVSALPISRVICCHGGEICADAAEIKLMLQTI